MGYQVKVISVNKHKKATGPNGPYEYASFVTSYNGDESERKIMHSQFKDNPLLEQQFDMLKPGMDVLIETVQSGKYKRVTKIIEVDSTTVQTKTTKNIGGGGNYDSLGAQIGNAITNACSTLGEKPTMKQIETRVWELILLGERTKSRLANGEHLIKVDEPVADPKTMNEDQYHSDEDVPF